jgi:hypothetical protein
VTLGGLARYATALIVAVMVLRGGQAWANDRVAELSRTLTSSSNEKHRLTAVVALAKIGNKSTLKPLVTALGDPSPKIRVVAAVALGRLGHRAALPSLRNAANDDTDGDVRERARAAAIAVARGNQLPHPFDPVAAPAVKKPRAGFGNQPRVIEGKPDVYVVIKSSSDDSPGRADKQARKQHAEIIRTELAEQCRTAANVTSAPAVASRYGLELRNIDLSVVKLAVSRTAGVIEVEAQLRLAISDEKGKMLSFLSGGAKVQVSQKTFQARHLPDMRREALENAMRGMFDKLLAHLREKPRA